MLTYHHFAELGLLPHLWSLSRGLSRRRVEYQSLICKNDPTQGTVLEGGRQLKGDDALVFIEFMLGVCHEEVDYMTTAFSRRRLHEQVLQSFKTSQRIARSGISPKVAPAVLALLIQGALPETEFKIFSGVRLDEVSDETSNLRSLGLMDFSSHDTGWIETRLPAWFANEILPGLLDQ